MDGIEHPLVPQWLKSSRVAGSQLTSPPSSDRITITHDGYERSRRGSGISSSVRGWHDREWEKDFDDILDKDKLFRRKYHHNHSDSVDSILSNKFEKDLLLRSQSMNSGSGRWRETRSPRTSGDRSNPLGNHAESNDMVTGVIGIKHKSLFEEEFPLLGAEDKRGGSEFGRVLPSSSNNCSPPTNTSSEITGNGLSLTSDEVPMTVVGSSSMVLSMQHTDLARTTSTPPGTMSLSMAETLVQGTSRAQTPPQSSIGTQKPEELALKQSRLLIPMTPLSPRSLVASPSEKSKVKTGQQQYPFSYSRSPSHSSHGAPGNSDVQKTISSNSRNVSTLQELNGFSLAAKDNSSPSRSRVIFPTGATASTSVSSPSSSSTNNSIPSARMALEKRPTFQTQSRSDFFKNLSKKSSSKNSHSDVSCALEKSEGDTSTAISANSLSESSSVITENAAAAGKPLKFSSKGEQQYSTNPVLHPDEEIAFLRSLGWEESAGEDEGLTEDEVQDFYEKFLKLQSSSNISPASTSKPDSIGT